MSYHIKNGIHIFSVLSLIKLCISTPFSAKPIDLLAQYVSGDDDDLEIQMHEPYTILVVSGESGSSLCQVHRK